MSHSASVGTAFPAPGPAEGSCLFIFAALRCGTWALVDASVPVSSEQELLSMVHPKFTFHPVPPSLAAFLP